MKCTFGGDLVDCQRPASLYEATGRYLCADHQNIRKQLDRTLPQERVEEQNRVLA